MSPRTLSRRDFIRAASAAGGGLVLAIELSAAEGWLAAAAGVDAADPEGGAVPPFSPNVWLRIGTDGVVTITVARSELGQGAHTAMPMLVAEELEADWSSIVVEPVVVTGVDSEATYGDMTTGGSSSVRGSWERLRRAGAVAREMLVSAAAQTWGVDRAACRAENGSVLHAASNRSLAYGQLAEAAAKIPPPEEVALKDPKEFRILGRRLPRTDTPAKVSGSAQYGIDVKVPGMQIAMVERCPVFGGKVASFDATRAQKIPGVRRVVAIDSGIAVVADSTWAAMKGREALSVVWDEGPNPGLDSHAIRSLLEEKSREEGRAVRSQGDPAGALAGAAKKIEAVYEVPFLAHATMEPQNCLAHVLGDRVEVWAPTQAPQWAQGEIARALGIPQESVMVHVTLSGGAFGRRVMTDFVVEAAQLSKAVGQPVKVVWTREDDMRHDFYRPATLHKMAAGLDASGNPVVWSHRVVGPSIARFLFGEEATAEQLDLVDGAAQLPYDIPNVQIQGSDVMTPVPVGWWRSVYHSQHAFANEAFLDEMAGAAGADPYQLRRRLLPADSRLLRPLDLAAEKAGWGTPLSSGRARGIACHACFGSFVAQVVEASVEEARRIRVHRVVCAVDCGPTVNPDTIEAQIEGAITIGLTAALRGEITLQGGRVQQGNFDDYPLLTFEEAPAVEVHIVPGNETLGGIGEPGLPPVAPALANAIFAATGKRVRRLPIRLA